MTPEKDVKKQGLGDRQALNGDYEKSGFHKGHLAPVYQADHRTVLMPPSLSPMLLHKTPLLTEVSGGY